LTNWIKYKNINKVKRNQWLNLWLDLLHHHLQKGDRVNHPINQAKNNKQFKIKMVFMSGILESSSEFDIFSPDKSVDKEPPQRNVELDEKLSKLTQEANAIERILPNCIINPYGRFKSFWSSVMLLLLVYV
jgi:hypothetical protein